MFGFKGIFVNELHFHSYIMVCKVTQNMLKGLVVYTLIEGLKEVKKCSDFGGHIFGGGIKGEERLSNYLHV